MLRPSNWHLAHINYSIMKQPFDHPVMADFRARLEPVNALAERAPGFVWRLISDEEYSDGGEAFGNPMTIINLTVWEGVEALERFTYGNREHLAVLRARRKWFETPSPAYVMWWLPAGTTPTPAMGKQRLDLLAAKGPTAEAFTFKEHFPKPAFAGDGATAASPAG